MKAFEKRPRFKHEWIQLDRMSPHPTVQREFRKPHADWIAANFDPDCFGELYVVPEAKRAGYYWVFDGQHRLVAAITVLGAGQKVYCRVYEDRPIEELAKIALGINSPKAWRAIDRFIQRVNAREPLALSIQGIATRHGLRIAAHPGSGVVRASTACDWVMQKAGGEGALERTFSILHGAWGDDQEAYDANLIRGVALLVNRYNGELADKSLVEKLKKHTGPARLLGRARDFSKVLGVKVPRAVAQVMANDYNSGRRSGRLPDWQ